MKHRKLDTKDAWFETGYKECKQQQIEMIRRGYKEFNKNDWVLWLVIDLFHKYTTKDLTGTIEIKKHDGTLIDVPFILRTPYPNKMIHQLSMKCGRKRLYGIPLVFNSFDSLCEISEIKIRWDIYEEWYFKNNDKPFDLHIKCVIIKYHLYFEKDNKNPSYHFFTVFSKDNTFDNFEDDNEDGADKYYGEFDLALNLSGSIVCDDWKAIIGDIYTLKNGDERCEFNDDELKVINELYSVMPDKEKSNCLLKDVMVDSEIQWDVYYAEKKELLKASFMADILPEPCFGFIDI